MSRRADLTTYRQDGADAARRGYPLKANPYWTATVDAAGFSHPRPTGFDAKGRAWAIGWTRCWLRGHARLREHFTYHGTRAHLLTLARQCRARGQLQDARLILLDLQDERARHPHRHKGA